jgi:hypothetical protein
VNRTEIERRLRRPSPLEAEYGRRTPTRRRGGQAARPRFRFPSSAGVAIVCAIAFVVLVRVAASAPASGAGPQQSADSAVGVEASKPIVSIPPASSPASSALAACAGGAVAAETSGWGFAGGTNFVLIKLAATNGACRLPAEPSASLIDAGGAVVAKSATSQAQQWVALSATLNARVGVTSLCDPASMITLDLGVGNIITIQLPPGFGQACRGGTSSLFIDDLAADH